MKIGLEGDKRKFQKATKAQKEAAITYGMDDDEVTRWPRCEVCKIDITGKKWPGSEAGKYLCTPCSNE